MGGITLTLDTILSATFHHARKWSEQLVSNQARDLLRFVIIKLYDEGRGNLINAVWTQAQTTIASKLQLSSKWVGVLTARLEEQGWIEHYSPKLPDGMNGSTRWRAGRQLKRLIISIAKSHLKQEKRRAKAEKSVPNRTSYFFPISSKLKNLSYPHTKKTEAIPAAITREPLLKQWMNRGKEQENGKNISTTAG